MSENLFDLSGKVAIVTGASRGLGQYFSRALAGAGADLVITSRKGNRINGQEGDPRGPRRPRLPEHTDDGGTRPGCLRQDRHPG